MKKVIMGVVAALAIGAMAETANTVKVTKFHQSYPYSGKATVEYTVGGTLPANAFAEIILNTDDTSATFTNKNIVTGANSFEIDFASSFGGALLLTNASFVVTIADFGGVQLWENGPYWAECNVGASQPAGYGYYFWWGDTVGYIRNGDKWFSVKDGGAIAFYAIGVTASTVGLSDSELRSKGYIDSAGNLVAAHDAATVHLGSPWRMPTYAESCALISNCTSKWTTRNGVRGRLVTGKGDYSDRSIFLPAAGYGAGNDVEDCGSNGYYWSSTSRFGYTSGGWDLSYLFSGNSTTFNYERYYGQPVRPVRLPTPSYEATGFVTYDSVPLPAISPASGTTFESSLTVSISCEMEGADVYYTVDGSEPTKDSTAYKRFKIYGKTTVKAVAYNAEYDLYSDVTTAEYALGTCANPVIAPDGGTAVVTEGWYVFNRSGQRVSIDQNGVEGTLRYTLDGTEPTIESAAYIGPITFDSTTTVKAKVFSESYFDSDVVEVVFTREWEQVATPAITVAETFSGSKTKCVINCATEGARIYYTLDGSDPNSHSTRYSGAFYITGACTLKAMAMLTDCINSEVAVATVTKELSIGDSMGAPDHAFTTSGDDGKAFYRVEDASAPNGEAMHSGDIGNSAAYGSFARTVLSTAVIGPGTVAFSWKASCEDDAPEYTWDHGEFAVDGVIQAYISGETVWTNVSVAVAGAGEHTLTWTYLKDDAEYAGEDRILVAGYNWASAEAYTHTTDVPVPYAWLAAHDKGVVDEYEAYESSAKATAANGRKVWECYLLGLDPQEATDDFKIMSFPMKADGTPDFDNLVFDPPQSEWNVPGATPKMIGASTLEGPWSEVPEGGDSTMKFFKIVVELP